MGHPAVQLWWPSQTKHCHCSDLSISLHVFLVCRDREPSHGPLSCGRGRCGGHPIQNTTLLTHQHQVLNFLLHFILLSAEIENLAMGHPAVAEAAVVAIPNAKWGERPLLVVVLKPGAVEGPGPAMQVVKEQLYK